MSIEKIKEVLATIKPPIDRGDEGIHDWAGGNIDDAYQYGLDDGEAQLAERLRALLSD